MSFSLVSVLPSITLIALLVWSLTTESHKSTGASHKEKVGRSVWGMVDDIFLSTSCLQLCDFFFFFHHKLELVETNRKEAELAGANSVVIARTPRNLIQLSR